jgi:sec-independent protein translocase protein TatA
MRPPGLPELMIILVIVVLLFGVGRVSKIGGELGQAIGNFRKGLREASKEEEKAGEEEA